MRSVFRCFIYGVLMSFVFTSQSSAEILCKLNFVSLEFPKMGGCSSTINSSGKFKYGSGCSNASSSIKKQQKMAGQVLGRWLGNFQKDVNLVIKEGDKPDGYISGIGHLSKAGSEKSMRQVSKDVRLKDIQLDPSSFDVVARYPAGIAGMKLSDLPYPHGYLFLDTQTGEVRITNEFGTFYLKGKCSN